MMALLTSVVIMLNAAALPARAADTPWPMLRGTAAGHARCAWEPGSDKDQIREWHFTSKPGRRFQLGLAVWASPALAIVEGRPMAFIGGYDQTLHALDLLTKQRRWFKITNGPIQCAPAVGYVKGRLAVFFGSADRSVYACDALSGKRLWTRELVKPSTTIGEVSVSAPFLHAGTLYITCFAYDRSLARNKQKGWLIALKMASGKELWRREVSQGFVSSPTGRPINGRLHLFVAARKGLVQGFDVSGARPVRLWRYQTAHEVLASPVVGQGAQKPRVFIGSKYGEVIAIDATTGERCWKRMAGNWVDNTACVGRIDGREVVFVGSHDYCTYAFDADDGQMLWRRRLGGEIYSAPCFFLLDGSPAVAVGSLDNYLYVLDARDGSVLSSYYVGLPVWDKVSKGETLWGSPAALQAGSQTAVIHGSSSGTVYILPLLGQCSLRSKARSPSRLWAGLGVTAGLFMLIVLPIVLAWPSRKPGEPT